MKAKISPRDIEQLSAYLDQQLDPGKRTWLEARLRAEPELRAAFGDLRRTRTLLRSLPRMKLPRNFMLTPQMVGMAQARVSSPRRIFPVFQFASALASLLFVVVLLGDILGVGTVSPPAPLAGAPSVSGYSAQDTLPSVDAGRSMAAATTAVEQPPSAAAGLESALATPSEAPAQQKILAESAPGVTPTITTTAPLTLTAPITSQAVNLAPTVEAGAPAGPVSVLQGESEQPDRSLWRAAEVSLALVALASALAAIYLRRHQ